ncbi:Crp/Fnr family transcriptional regulator [Mycolicibacterium sp. 018/SC-01/001]|uniref:Crp/Fnr family transcriptional regulator n=1 Tax=Mycolicibacterium sp. 018/SC-01/001 TaxID=2592069 RepID=UPI00117D8ADC|nr:Crp/Fnr family transcriptional regulator [Mycolicibacterium sp. 018/SC-01/001]TRW88461.1 Crp/Fnr family transcriptional regulator [Mycolicibacterium sp. 018/SC-01/001]
MTDAPTALLDAAMPGLPSGSRLRTMRWRAGEAIFIEGDLETCLYVIRAGRVRVGLNRDTDRECLFQVLGPGELCGEESVFDPGPRSTCAVAITDVTATRLERHELTAMMAAHPEMAQRFLRILARRIRSTSSTITDTVYASVAARVAKHLLGLAQRFGVQEHGTLRVPMDLTQEQFAHLVGSSRESVNKTLCHFASRGWIVVAKGSIVIRESEPLAARMHGARRVQLAGQ